MKRGMPLRPIDLGHGRTICKGRPNGRTTKLPKVMNSFRISSLSCLAVENTMMTHDKPITGIFGLVNERLRRQVSHRDEGNERQPRIYECS